MKKVLPFLSILFLLGASSCATAQKQKTTQNSKPVINHIAQYVQDLSKATRFYMEVVGLDTIPEPFHDGKHTWFTVGSGAALHLIQGAKGVTEHDKNSHLCFSVGSIDSYIANLRTHKVPFENWAGQPDTVTRRVDGVRQIYFKDPDGYWIEVNDDRRR